MLKYAHIHSLNNISDIKLSQLVGCYSCIRIFNSNEVIQSTDNGATAICPYCSVDSLLSEQSPYTLDKKTLKKLNDFWF